MKLQPDGFVSDIFSVGRLSTEDKETPEGKDTARCLNPLVIDGSGDRCDVNADFLGNLLHFQRYDRLGAFVKKSLLMFDDRTCDPKEGTLTLLDRFDKPLSATDFSFDELLFFFGGFGIHQPSTVIFADSQGRYVFVDEANSILLVVLLLDDHVRGNQWYERLHKRGPRFWVQLVELFSHLLDRVDRVAGFLLDHQHAILCQIIEMVIDDQPQFIDHLCIIGQLI